MYVHFDMVAIYDGGAKKWTMLAHNLLPEEASAMEVQFAGMHVRPIGQNRVFHDAANVLECSQCVARMRELGCELQN